MVDIVIVCAILVAAMYLFATEKLRVDLVALLIMTTLMLVGVVRPGFLSVQEAIAGFSNKATITIAAMFILTAGLVKLLPSLADEFFRRGVRNYVGTAWEVSDEGAVLFAETLYENLLRSERNEGVTLGEALCKARQTLHKERAVYGALWAACQHYGDPQLRW